MATNNYLKSIRGFIVCFDDTDEESIATAVARVGDDVDYYTSHAEKWITIYRRTTRVWRHVPSLPYLEVGVLDYSMHLVAKKAEAA